MTVLNDKNFDIIEKTEGNSIIKFYSESCGPCKLMDLYYNDIEKENPDIEFFECNVSEAPSKSFQLVIQSVPSVMFLRDGKEIFRFAGYKPKNDFKKLIEVFKSED